MVRALVLTPTRELAQQVGGSFKEYGSHSAHRTVVAYGGVSINNQLTEIDKGVDILVATPGRLIDILTRGAIDLSQLAFFVLDDAYRMLDMGFVDYIRRILRSVPDTRQTLLFSATFDDAVFKLSQKLLTDPTRIQVDQRNAAASQVEQIAYEVDKQRKREITSFLIGSKNWQQVLVFTRTKQAADDLAREMCKDGLKTESIHGDKSQGARERALEGFKNGSIRVLVATDVASRGLDIQQLKYVINYELPYDAEDYIHRIGRTGAGRRYWCGRIVVLRRGCVLSAGCRASCETTADCLRGSPVALAHRRGLSDGLGQGGPVARQSRKRTGFRFEVGSVISGF